MCRYTYDRNELERLGEDYVLEPFDPAEVAALGDVPGAAVADILPSAVRDACRGANPGFDDTVLLQAFDWTSSKRGVVAEGGSSEADESSEAASAAASASDDPARRSRASSWWSCLAARASDIAAMGFTHAWLPPPSQSVSPEGYLPGKLFDLHASAYGDKASLVALCKALKDAGVVPVCDVVVNHRTADFVDPETGVYNVFADLDPDGEKVSWGAWAITCDDPHYGGKGSPDSGENYAPAPDLDHQNPELRATLKRWMAWLRDEIGFGGFRFDFVRGYAPEFVEEYARETFGGGHRKTPQRAFCVGENWVDLNWEGATLSYNQDGPRAKLAEWIADVHGVAAAFDFPTKGILQRAIEHTEYWRLRDPAGRPPGLLGWVPQRAVTFLDNHDTGHPQMHWPFPTDRMGLGYAYALTHPGIPCVFWPHAFGCEDEAADDSEAAASDRGASARWDDESSGRTLAETIRALLALRKSAKIVASSPIKILAAEDDLYVARVAHSLTVKLGPRFEMPDALLPKPPEWRLAISGDDWAVWERVEGYEGPGEGDARAKSEYGFDEEEETFTAANVKRVFEEEFGEEECDHGLIGALSDEETRRASGASSTFPVRSDAIARRRTKRRTLGGERRVRRRAKGLRKRRDHMKGAVGFCARARRTRKSGVHNPLPTHTRPTPSSHLLGRAPARSRLGAGTPPATDPSRARCPSSRGATARRRPAVLPHPHGHRASERPHRDPPRLGEMPDRHRLGRTRGVAAARARLHLRDLRVDARDQTRERGPLLKAEARCPSSRSHADSLVVLAETHHPGPAVLATTHRRDRDNAQI